MVHRQKEYTVASFGFCAPHTAMAAASIRFIVVSFAPRLVGVVSRGYVDLDAEVEQLFLEDNGEVERGGYFEPVRL
jgi:hypothetical protein